MADRFVTARPGPLLELLAAHFSTWSRNTLRQRLRLGCVEVDGVIATRTDQQVNIGAAVAIRSKGEATAPRAAVAAVLPVLHLDDDLLAIDKPAGLLSVSTDDETSRTALAMARGLLPAGRSDLWPAHRIDRETSGVLLFARTLVVRDAVQGDWANTQKVYDAIVEGVPAAMAGTIDQPLREDDHLRVRVGAHPEARPARTRYRVVQRGRDRCRLEVELDTGRKHQIRAHLAWLGHPIVGDDRYGTKASRLCLHAARLTLRHPRDGSLLQLTAPMPAALAAELMGH